MPKVSEFYGIEIGIYYHDHPPPHFHAIYGSDEALIMIPNGEVYRGILPERGLRIVREWMALHTDELTDNWDRAERKEPLVPIEPLS